MDCICMRLCEQAWLYVLPVNNTRTGNNLHAEKCDGAAEMFADIVYMIFSLPLGLFRLSNTTLQ
jgi:hypothetical protein